MAWSCGIKPSSWPRTPQSGFSQLRVRESPAQTGLSQVGHLLALVTVKFRAAGIARSRSPYNVMSTCFLSLHLLSLPSSDLICYQEGSLLWMPKDPGLHSSSPATPTQRADFLFSASRKRSKARLQTGVMCPPRANHCDQGVAPAEGLGLVDGLLA